MEKITVDFLPICQSCEKMGINRQAEYDSKTKLGSWAYLCKYCYKIIGNGLGLGKGQKLELKK